MSKVSSKKNINHLVSLHDDTVVYSICDNEIEKMLTLV